ncbi:MAG: hypothetical protein JWN70_4474 [Planctomycetaceae bacterium]|nr:hypothetical protein [Planctomycetaceae bacterium]
MTRLDVWTTGSTRYHTFRQFSTQREITQLLSMCRPHHRSTTLATRRLIKTQPRVQPQFDVAFAKLRTRWRTVGDRDKWRIIKAECHVAPSVVVETTPPIQRFRRPDAQWIRHERQHPGDQPPVPRAWFSGLFHDGAALWRGVPDSP